MEVKCSNFRYTADDVETVNWGDVHVVPQWSCCSVEQAEKVIEEAREVLYAVIELSEIKSERTGVRDCDRKALVDYYTDYDNACIKVRYEAADLVMALSNLVAELTHDMRYDMRRCELKNAQRGNYPEVEDV